MKLMRCTCSMKSMQMSVQSEIQSHKISMQQGHKNIKVKKTVSVSQMKVIPSNIKKKIIIISPMLVVDTKVDIFNRMNCCVFNTGPVDTFCGFCLHRYHQRKGGHLREGTTRFSMAANMDM